MAITQSFPKATPGLKDLLLGTKVEKNSIATRNFTVADIVDICKDYTFRPYKVYTALLTQSGESRFYDKVQGDTLDLGVTYRISVNSENVDLTVFGAPNSDIGTYFICTNASTLPVNGTISLLWDPGAPVATVLENTIGNIWFTYKNNINSNGLFISNKTSSFIQLNTDTSGPDGTLYSIISFDDSAIGIITYNPILDNDGTQLTNTPIEIRVYN